MIPNRHRGSNLEAVVAVPYPAAATGRPPAPPASTGGDYGGPPSPVGRRLSRPAELHDSQPGPQAIGEWRMISMVGAAREFEDPGRQDVSPTDDGHPQPVTRQNNADRRALFSTIPGDDRYRRIGMGTSRRLSEGAAHATPGSPATTAQFFKSGRVRWAVVQPVPGVSGTVAPRRAAPARFVRWSASRAGQLVRMLVRRRQH